MPKRAKLDNRRSRQQDKTRKRLKREQQANSSDVAPPDETSESIDSCGSLDGAISAPLVIFQGLVGWGFHLMRKNPWPRCRPHLV